MTITVKGKKNGTVTRRSRSKYPALDPSLNLKSRRDLLDQDYISKLSEKDKDWLNRFNEEFCNDNFNHPGKQLHKKRKPCDDANNARNRDAYGICKANNILEDGSKIPGVIEGNRSTRHDEVEDHLIALIDGEEEINEM